MTPEQLAEIDARAKTLRNGGMGWLQVAANLAPDDFDALIAEVRRLRAAVDAALALHQSIEVAAGGPYLAPDGQVLVEAWPARMQCSCNGPWPCATVRALAPVADPTPHTTSDEETSNG
jgi:hypothetical protein